MRIDISFLPALAASFILVLARVGTMLMLLPGLGELNLPVRIRLTVALLLAAILLPLHQNAYQIDLRSFGPLVAMLGTELFIGAVAKDASDFQVKNQPGHPAADASGNVKYPNVNPLIEMTDMRDAERSYSANINVINATRAMIQRTLDILKS